MIIRVNRISAPELLAYSERAQIGEDLIDVHVGARSRACLIDVNGELGHPPGGIAITFAVQTPLEFIARRHDTLGDLLRDHPEVPIHIRARSL